MAEPDHLSMCLGKLPSGMKMLPTQEQMAKVIRQLLVQKWRLKKEKKDTQQMETIIDSYREVRQAHYRRALAPVKKEKLAHLRETNAGLKRALDSQSGTIDPETNSNKRHLTSDGYTSASTFTASSIRSLEQNPSQEKKNKEHPNSMMLGKETSSNELTGGNRNYYAGSMQRQETTWGHQTMSQMHKENACQHSWKQGEESLPYASTSAKQARSSETIQQRNKEEVFTKQTHDWQDPDLQQEINNLTHSNKEVFTYGSTGGSHNYSIGYVKEQTQEPTWAKSDESLQRDCQSYIQESKSSTRKRESYNKQSQCQHLNTWDNQTEEFISMPTAKSQSGSNEPAHHHSKNSKNQKSTLTNQQELSRQSSLNTETNQETTWGFTGENQISYNGSKKNEVARNIGVHSEKATSWSRGEGCRDNNTKEESMEHTTETNDTYKKQSAASTQQNGEQTSKRQENEEAESKPQNSEELQDDDPVLNPEPPTKMEEEMDSMFDMNSYPAVNEIINAEIPTEGAYFRTREDAFYSYALYARKSGFAVKKFSSKRSGKDHEIYLQVFACNKEGATNMATHAYKKRRATVLVRTSCEARILVKRNNKGWFVKKVQLEHNHPLEPTDYLIRFAHCHKRMTELDRKLIDLLQMSRLPPRQMMLIFRKIRGRFRGIPFDAVDLSNIQSHQNKIEKDHDIDHCIERFKTLQKKVPGFYYAMEKDKERRVRSLFWMDAMCVMNYKLFGEYISFDTTFSTNKYNLPFVPIVGVNNHGSTVLFGVGLLKDETTSSFKWVLKTFVDAMGGKEPKTIITDQCKAMKRAIQEVLTNTVHRNCYYHIVTKMSQKEGSYFATHPELSENLRHAAKNAFTPEEFERAWEAVIERYGGKGEKHLDKLFRIRSRWVPAYFMDNFFPFSSSTGRSESTNNMWKCYSRNTDTITKFLEQYEVIQDKCLSALDKKNLKSTLKQAQTLTHHPFEAQALQAYTHDIFLKFQTEITNSTAFAVKGTLQPGHIKLERLTYYDKMEFRRNFFDVFYDEEKKNFSCECKKMQRDGIHCCHVIKVLVHLGINNLPDSFIIQRWRKNLEVNLPTTGDDVDVTNTEETLRFAGAMSSMADLCNLACPNDRAYKVMVECLRDMRTRVMAELKGKETNEEEATANSDGERFYDPPITRRRTTNRGNRPRPGSEKGPKVITCSHCKTKGHNRTGCSVLKSEIAANRSPNQEHTANTRTTYQTRNNHTDTYHQESSNRTTYRTNQEQDIPTTPPPPNNRDKFYYHDGRIRTNIQYLMFGTP